MTGDNHTSGAHGHPALFLTFFMLLTLPVQSCALMDNQRRWGEDVTFCPSWDTIGRSALGAATSPRVIVYAAGALLSTVRDADRRIVRYATKHTPTTGSPQSALTVSSTLRAASLILFHASILATPSGNDPGCWLASKAKGYMVQGGAAALTNEMVFGLKDQTRRKRPQGGHNNSFPSGHATNTALFTTLTSKNVSTMPLSQTTKTMADVCLTILLAATAWERVEAGAHYPSDVLAGMALGSFMGMFFNDAFMGMEGTVTPQISPMDGGLFVGVTIGM